MNLINFAINNPNFTFINRLTACISSNSSAVDYILANPDGLLLSNGVLKPWNINYLSQNISMAKYIIANPNGFNINNVLEPWDIISLSHNSGMAKYIIDNPDGFYANDTLLPWNNFPIICYKKLQQIKLYKNANKLN